MAKKAKRITDAPNEPRVDPTWRHAILLSVFAVLAIVSIFTVLIPELRDDGSADEADAAGSSTETAGDVSAPSAPPHSAPAHAP
jgi:hypothetical protein